MKLERASATQVHGMEAVTSDEGFKTARGDDSSLNAFGALTHRGQRPQTADQPAQWQSIASAFVRPDGVVMERVRIKEEDFVPQSAGLMKVKVED